MLCRYVSRNDPFSPLVLQAESCRGMLLLKAKLWDLDQPRCESPISTARWRGSNVKSRDFIHSIVIEKFPKLGRQDNGEEFCIKRGRMHSCVKACASIIISITNGVYVGLLSSTCNMSNLCHLKKHIGQVRHREYDLL